MGLALILFLAGILEQHPDWFGTGYIGNNYNHTNSASTSCKNNSGGPLSALTCCVNVRLLSGDKKNIAFNLFSKLGWELGLYYASYDDFHPDILARMYT